MGKVMKNKLSKFCMAHTYVTTDPFYKDGKTWFAVIDRIYGHTYVSPVINSTSINLGTRKHTIVSLVK